MGLAMSDPRAGYWSMQAGSPGTAPSNGRYRADIWASPTMVTLATTDDDGYNQHDMLTGLSPGNKIRQMGRDDSQNYQMWNVASVIDQGSWVQLSVEAIENGTSFAAPNNNLAYLLEFITVESAGPSAYSIKQIVTSQDHWYVNFLSGVDAEHNNHVVVGWAMLDDNITVIPLISSPANQRDIVLANSVSSEYVILNPYSQCSACVRPVDGSL